MAWNVNNYATANGLLSGLNTGIDNFLRARRENTLDERERQKQEDDQKFRQAGLLRQGLTKDPTTGDYVLTPEAEEEKRTGLLKSQSEQADYSPAGESEINLRKGLIHSFGLPDIDMTGMSSHDLRTKIDPQMDVGAKLYTAKAGKDVARGAATTKSQDDAMKDVMHVVSTARGNPAVQQAEKDLYQSKKADSLYALYGDPNNLTPAQAKLYAMEAAKMANGGVPTQEELKGLDPSTWSSELKAMASKLTGNPTPANVGAFITKLHDYTTALKGDAQETVSEAYGRVIEARRRHMGDANYQDLKRTYIDRFQNEDARAAAKKSDAQFSDDVIQYAKAHNITPAQANQIKLLRSGN